MFDSTIQITIKCHLDLNQSLKLNIPMTWNVHQLLYLLSNNFHILKRIPINKLVLIYAGKNLSNQATIQSILSSRSSKHFAEERDIVFFVKVDNSKQEKSQQNLDKSNFSDQAFFNYLNFINENLVQPQNKHSFSMKTDDQGQEQLMNFQSVYQICPILNYKLNPEVLRMKEKLQQMENSNNNQEQKLIEEVVNAHRMEQNEGIPIFQVLMFHLRMVLIVGFILVMLESYFSYWMLGFILILLLIHYKFQYDQFVARNHRNQNIRNINPNLNPNPVPNQGNANIPNQQNTPPPQTQVVTDEMLAKIEINFKDLLICFFYSIYPSWNIKNYKINKYHAQNIINSSQTNPNVDETKNIPNINQPEQFLNILQQQMQNLHPNQQDTFQNELNELIQQFENQITNINVKPQNDEMAKLEEQENQIIENKQELIKQKEELIDLKEELLEAKEEQIEIKELLIQKIEKEIELREELNELQQDNDKKEQLLEKEEELIVELENAIEEREEKIEMINKELIMKEQLIEQKDQEIETKEEEIYIIEQVIKEKEELNKVPEQKIEEEPVKNNANQEEIQIERVEQQETIVKE